MSNNKDGRSMYQLPMWIRNPMMIFQPVRHRHKLRPQGIHRKKLGAIILNLERCQPCWTDAQRKTFAAKIFLLTS